MPNALDIVAGRYQLGARLGAGGMGEVRAATDLRLGREVAIKLLRPSLAEDDDIRERFKREARAAARISHPNVVVIFDTGEDGRVPYIVMERLSGETLADALADGPLTPAHARTLTLEVLAALEAAHARGVLHRDIKPANILWGPDGHVRVADFGVAKIIPDTDANTTGVLFGTAPYLAPERLAGGPASPATDVYAVGVILFEALAGQPPFGGSSPAEIAASISATEPKSLGDLCPHVEPGMVAVVERAIAKDPAGRFQSASAMVAALHAVAGEPDQLPSAAATLPMSAVPTTTSETARYEVPPPRPERHRRRWLPAAISLGALALFVIVGFALAASPDEPGAPRPLPSTQGTGTSPVPSTQRVQPAPTTTTTVVTPVSVDPSAVRDNVVRGAVAARSDTASRTSEGDVTPTDRGPNLGYGATSPAMVRSTNSGAPSKISAILARAAFNPSSRRGSVSRARAASSLSNITNM